MATKITSGSKLFAARALARIFRPLGATASAAGKLGSVSVLKIERSKKKEKKK